MHLKINNESFKFELAKKSNGDIILWINVSDDETEVMNISLCLDEDEFTQLKELVEV
jgi:hypothetical protein